MLNQGTSPSLPPTEWPPRGRRSLRAPSNAPYRRPPFSAGVPNSSWFRPSTSSTVSIRGSHLNLIPSSIETLSRHVTCILPFRFFNFMACIHDPCPPPETLDSQFCPSFESPKYFFRKIIDWSKIRFCAHFPTMTKLLNVEFLLNHRGFVFLSSQEASKFGFKFLLFKNLKTSKSDETIARYVAVFRTLSPRYWSPSLLNAKVFLSSILSLKIDFRVVLISFTHFSFESS